MSKKHKTPRITFNRVSEHWLEYIKLHVKRSTYENYMYLLKKHILPYFGKVDMRLLSCGMINDFTVRKLTGGKLKQEGGISKKYLQDMLSIVKSIAGFCEQEYGICSRIRRSRGVKAEKKEFRVLESEEQKRLSDRLINDDHPYNIGILLSLFAGLRIGEVCGLKWEDYNEKDGVITVRRTVQRITDNSGGTIFLVGTPKTKASERTIPLPKFLCELLSKAKKSPDNTVIPSKNDYAEPSAMRRYFKKLLESCGVPHIRYHDLRHTFASNCVQLDFDIKTLSEILGHTNAAMTLNRYVHSSLMIKRRYMELVTL